MERLHEFFTELPDTVTVLQSVLQASASVLGSIHMCVVMMSAACVYSGHDLGCPIFGCVDRHQLPSFSLHLPVALGCSRCGAACCSVYSETLAGCGASVCTGVSRVFAVVVCVVCWLGLMLTCFVSSV